MSDDNELKNPEEEFDKTRNLRPDSADNDDDKTYISNPESQDFNGDKTFVDCRNHHGDYRDHLIDQISFKISDPENKYTYIDHLGKGGMGEVLLVKDNDIKRNLAMKTALLGDQTANLDSRQQASYNKKLLRFIEEVQITGQLEHPNIVPVHEMGLNSRTGLFFTMKVVKGDTLKKIIEKRSENDERYTKKYPLQELLRIFEKICDGMSYAHAKGVIHRDLKPENIMIGEHGEVMIMDWGLAKIIQEGEVISIRKELNLKTEKIEKRESDLHSSVLTDESSTHYNIDTGEIQTAVIEKEIGNQKISPELTLQSQVIGTLHYMPPEQAKGEIDKLDVQADIFSLGGILYSILTGETPYQGDTLYSLLSSAIGGKVIPPAEQAPELNINSELNAIVMKAMAEKISDRYSSVEKMQKDLHAYSLGHTITAKEYNPLQVIVKWMRRHWKQLTIGVSAVLIIIISFTIFYALQQLENRKLVRENIEKIKVLIQDSSAIKTREKSTIAYNKLLDGEKLIMQGFKKDPLNQELLDLKHKVGMVLYNVSMKNFDWNITRQAVRILSDIDKVDIASLEQRLETAEKQKVQLDKTYVNNIINGVPSLGLSALQEQEQIVNICTKPGKHTTELLMTIIKNYWPAIEEKKNAFNSQKISVLTIAISSLSYLENTNHIHPNPEIKKNPVEFLTGLLKELYVKDTGNEENNRIKTDAVLSIVIAKALGNFNDYRSDNVFLQKRIESGINSNFWNKSKKYYKNIELPESLVKKELSVTEELVKRGTMLFYKELYNTALLDFEKAEKLNCRDIQLYINRGRIFFNLKQYDKALADCKLALKQSMVNVDTLLLKALSLEKLSDYQQAIKVLDQALKIDRENHFLFYTRGRLKAFLNEELGAISDLSEAINLNRKREMYFILRANMYSRLGDHKYAEEDISHALKLTNDNEYIFYYLGLIKNRDKKYNSALQYCDKAIKLKPDYIDAIILRTSLLWNTMRKRTSHIKIISEKEYQKAVNLNKKRPETFINIGNGWFENNQFNSALENYNHAISLAPDLAIAFYYRGKCYLKLNKKQKALSDFNYTIKKNPIFYDARLARGKINRELKNYSTAVKDYKWLIKNKLKLYESYIGLGEILALQNKHDYAVQQFTEAINIVSLKATGYIKRGKAYYKLKKYILAKKDLEKANRFSENWESQLILGAINQDQKNWTTALFHYSRFLQLNPRHKLLTWVTDQIQKINNILSNTPKEKKMRKELEESLKQAKQKLKLHKYKQVIDKLTRWESKIKTADTEYKIEKMLEIAVLLAFAHAKSSNYKKAGYYYKNAYDLGIGQIIKKKIMRMKLTYSMNISKYALSCSICLCKAYAESKDPEEYRIALEYIYKAIIRNVFNQLKLDNKDLINLLKKKGDYTKVSTYLKNAQKIPKVTRFFLTFKGLFKEYLFNAKYRATDLSRYPPYISRVLLQLNTPEQFKTIDELLDSISKEDFLNHLIGKKKSNKAESVIEALFKHFDKKLPINRYTVGRLYEQQKVYKENKKYLK